MKKTVILLISFLSAVNFTFSQWKKTSCTDLMPIRCIETNGENIYAGTDGKLYLSTDFGLSWLPVIYDKPAMSLFSFNTHILLGSDAVYISTDNSNKWIKTNLTKNVYAFDTLAGKIYAGTYDGVYISHDYGYNWEPTGLTQNIRSLVISGNTIYAGADEDTEMFLSEDGGKNWVSAGLSKCCNICQLETCGSFIYGRTGNVIFRTNDKGISWDTLNFSDVHSLAVKGSTLFAGTSEGVYISKDYGDNWISWNLNMTNFDIISLKISENYVYAGTWENGIWKRPLSEITNIHKANDDNSIIVYPNPVVDFINVKIPFHASKPVNYKIYDLSGKMILKGALSEHTIDVTLVKNGIYSLLLVNDENVTCKKIIIN